MSTTTLPIVCAWCERLRTSAGRWEETGDVDRHPAEATHGICPDCLVEEQRLAALAVAPLPKSLIPARARTLP